MHKTNTLLGLAAAAAIFAAAPAMAQDVKLGFLADVTGGIAAFAPGMIASAQLAIDEVNAQGGILDGKKLVQVTADSGCSAETSGPAADRLVNTEKVTAIFGAYCTGASLAGANTAAIPGNVVMVSPASSAPTVTTLKDNDLFYRTVVSDAFQGVKAADLLISKGTKNVAVTYVNNDYGKGLADVFAKEFTAKGGTVAANVAHEDGKADYRPEIGQMESSGADTLVIFGYLDTGGGVILNQALETGSFKLFVGGDGMAGDAIFKGRDAKALEGMITTKGAPSSGGDYDVFAKLAADAKLDPAGVYVTQSYDATFALALAIEKNGNADRAGLSKALRAVTSGTGEKIEPGEWKKAVDLIKAGKDINYNGASGTLDFDAAGDVAGAIDWYLATGGKTVDQGNIP
jgi:branched-chain amino acid transport system substrate-binding protein